MNGQPARSHPEIREAIQKLCSGFPGEYWRAKDRDRAYPTEFVQTLTREGYLSVLIPEEYGGSGLGLSAATAILEEIHASGCNGGACHAQMYVMGTVLKHGSSEQKARYLPAVASGEMRLQAFAVTEPDAGTDTTRVSTFARREGDRYIVNGQKIWISRAEHSDLMVLLCRTAPRDAGRRTSDGMSVLLVDMREAVGRGLTIRPIRTMLNHATTELFFDNLEVPLDNLIGREGEGFRYIVDGMNAERILIASECIGDARFFVDRASTYARERKVFGRAIGENQGVQFPIARAYVQLQAAPPDGRSSDRAVRSWPALRHGSQHGKTPGFGGLLVRRRPVPADLWRFRVCRGVRYRAQVPGNTSVSGRADIDQPHSQPRGRSRPGHAEVVLMYRRCQFQKTVAAHPL